jgi:hypothetical protein
MIITLDVFSGMPNPSWKLNEKDAKKFVERFASRSVLDAENMEAPLGYRGFSIETASDVKRPDTLPTKFHVGGTVADGFKAKGLKNPLLSLDEMDDATKWLLSKSDGAIKEDVMSYVKDTLKQQKKGIKEVAPKEIVEDTFLKDITAKSPCIIQSTAYNPAFWNDPAYITRNNCYAYAMNYRSNTFPQPGRRSGHPAPFPPTCANIRTASNWDGCKSTCSGGNKLVALVIWPGNDYHWYRKHSAGFWGHKPGGTAARNVDSLNRVINGTTLTPFNCARGPYSIFCSYLYSPTGMIVS